MKVIIDLTLTDEGDNVHDRLIVVDALFDFLCAGGDEPFPDNFIASVDGADLV